jgi:hypothetical protein
MQSADHANIARSAVAFVMSPHIELFASLENDDVTHATLDWRFDE